jgi:HlyD family secretion protein
MYKIKTIAFVTGIATLFTACNNNKVSFDASGSFEAEETIISSEATGTIKKFELEEGQTLNRDKLLATLTACSCI